MTTWGGFGMLVCIFIMIPIVLLHRSRLSGGALWLVGIPAIAAGNYIGWSVGISAFGFGDLGLEYFHKDLALMSAAVAPVITLFVWIARIRRLREVASKREEIRRAIAKITADGVVHGPKGPYVRHRRWNTGTRTGNHTGHGPYGIPAP